MVMTLKTNDTSSDVLEFSESDFYERMNLCSVEQLQQCIRLLGMYLALYKRGHGELDASAYMGLLNHDPADLKLAELMADGMDEANAMLLMVQSEPMTTGFTAPIISHRIN
jgi:hypothetical protein